MPFKLIFTSLIFISLVSCGGTTAQEYEQSLILNFDFFESAEGFSIDTADYHVEHQLNDQIISELSPLPEPFEYRKGIKFSWHNYSDDMKGFIKKKITGLNANSQFKVDFRVDVLTFMSEFCGGIGGSPGASVRVKAALLTDEPLKFIDHDSLSPTYRIDIDDGQSGGEDVTVLGHIGLPIPCDDHFFANPVWEIKPLTNDENFLATTNSQGEAWIYVSIDSGFEGITTFYLTEIELHIQAL